ncbi:MAG: hypothetical protein E6559_22430, partial [Pantoea sp.]|nr:hypothetical protein [Pantoea sp.]
GVAERLKAAVLKTADGKPSESSNLSSSATFLLRQEEAMRQCRFADVKSITPEGWPSGLRQRS